MKKFNYFYFIFMTLMWLVIYKFFNILAKYIYPAWIILVVLLIYAVWYILSAPLFYVIRKNKGVKKEFTVFYCMEAQWTTLWIDIYNGELAYLCMFNPFKVYYLPLNSINNAKLETYYSKDKKYLYIINCSFYINNKKNKIRIETNRMGYLRVAENARTIIDKTQKFVDILNEDYKDIHTVINFHGILCRYGMYRIMGENKPILTLVDSNDWYKSLQYDFTEVKYGFWCHFLTDKELDEFL